MDRLQNREDRRRFDNEWDFQEAVIAELRASNYTNILTGRGSALDEYIVNRNFPFFLVSILEFKFLGNDLDNTGITMDEVRLTFEKHYEDYRSRLLFLIYIGNEKFLESLNNILGNEIVGRYILFKNNAIEPFISTFNPESFRIFLNEERINLTDVNQLLETENILFFSRIQDLINILVTIFGENHIENINILRKREDNYLTLLNFILELDTVMNQGFDASYFDCKLEKIPVGISNILRFLNYLRKDVPDDFKLLCDATITESRMRIKQNFDTLQFKLENPIIVQENLTKIKNWAVQIFSIK